MGKHLDCAHASSHTDGEEKSGSGSSGSKRADQAKETLETAHHDYQSCVLLTLSEPRSTHIQNAEEEDSDRRNDGCDLVIDKNAPGHTHRGRRNWIAAGTTSSCRAAGETQNGGKSTTTKRTTGRRHGEHIVDTNSTRGVNQTKEHTPRVRRGDDEGHESGESTRSVDTPRTHASMAERTNRRRRRVMKTRGADVDETH